jgi:HD-GYP domain-containing protein (c-di-GMP phosphodiesterase class II)
MGMPFEAGLIRLKVYAGPLVHCLQENYSKALFMLTDSINRCDNSAHSQSTALWVKHIAETTRLSDEEVQQYLRIGYPPG